MTTATRVKERARVRRMAEQGLSNRVIAGRVGVSEATVRRWRAADAPATQSSAPADAPAAQDSASPDAPVTHPAAPSSASPGVLAVTQDDELRYHLGVLAEAGHDAQAAIARAVQFLSDAYAYAWDQGITDRGTIPDLRVQVRGDPWPQVPWQPRS